MYPNKLYPIYYRKVKPVKYQDKQILPLLTIIVHYVIFKDMIVRYLCIPAIDLQRYSFWF